MAMNYRILGGTGIEVSAYCLGTMMFGAAGNPDHDICVQIIRTALDRGINFVDTADMYSDGESEQITGKALKGRRDDIVLATKVHFPMGEGRNRAFGCSTFPAEQIIDAYWVADRRGLLRFRTEQPPYSLLARGIESSVLPTCQQLGMGVLTWSPLAWGFLSGRYREAQDIDLTVGRPALAPHRFDPALPGNAAKFQAMERLTELAAAAGCSLPQLAVAFPVAHPAVTSVIIGPRTMQQLQDLLDGASLALNDDILDQIDQIVPPGANRYNPDQAWSPPALADPALRRRPFAERSAA
jgi:aryl-alcohol dehydrogenase-like predicted oxidoreductase